MGRIDVHAHLLPRVDDGSQSIEESIEIARQMVAAGYSTLVCTPHIWPTLDNDAMTIALRVAELQGTLDEAGIPLDLRPGGEMHLTRNFVRTPVEDYITYDLAGRYALFDFWSESLPPYFEHCVRRLVNAGITPVLAHPERIAAIQNAPEVVEHAADIGLLLQCNLECLGESITTERGRLATKWLREGRYFMIGSDLHRIGTLDRRLIGLQRVAELVGTAELDRLTIDNPAKVLGI